MKKIIKKLCFLLLLLFTIAFVSCIGTYANASNNNVTPVYWYITDNGTTLHLSGTKPTNPNYVEGNNDFQSQKRNDDYLKKTYQKLTGKSDSKYPYTTHFKDDKLELQFTDSNHKKIGESQKPSDFFNSPVYNATKIIIDNEIAPSSLDFRYMHNVYEISNLQYLNTINLKQLDFDYCSNIQSLNLSTFNTANFTSMSSMFSGCKSLQSLDLSSFNTSSVTSMWGMFNNCYSLQSLDLSSFNTSSVMNMDWMFSWCKSLQSLDLSSFNTSSVTSMSYMFNACDELKTIYASTDLYKSNISETSKSMFHNCNNLIGGNGTKYDGLLDDGGPMAVIDSPNKKGYLTYKEPTKQTKTLTSAYKSNTSLIAGLPSQESELRNDKHFYLDNNLQKNSWVYYVKDYYHVDGSGNIEKSKWIEERYVGSDGKMYRGRQTPDGQWVGYDGLVVNVTQDLQKSILVEIAEPDSWYRTQSGLWYYFENDRTTTKKGWFNDKKDDQWYYLEPSTGIMQVGWVNIDGKDYYFNESHDNEPNWYEVEDGFYESYGKKVKAYGSMFKNEETPDGYWVNNDGEYIKKDNFLTAMNPKVILAIIAVIILLINGKSILKNRY